MSQKVDVIVLYQAMKQGLSEGKVIPYFDDKGTRIGIIEDCNLKGEDTDEMYILATVKEPNGNYFAAKIK